MKSITIDGKKLKKFVIAGANRLNKNKANIDSLNVFPVPDGDTGTNMSLTMLAAAKEVSKITSNKAQDIAKALSIGSLRGARGNSGVILSQLFRGFSKTLEGKDIVSTKDLAEALTNGMETAYKAVMKPKEGTILTISKAMSEKALEIASKTEDIHEFMREVLSYANSILDKTINMLPELKQAGVVDAGGKGLITIFEGGFFDDEEELNVEYIKETISPKNIENVDIKYGYCTEFFINLEKGENKEEELKQFLNNIGDSIVVASDDDFIKIHVHTDNPGKVLDYALKIGSLDNIKIENMRTQHSNLIDFSQNKETKMEIEKEFGFVAVSVGSGINRLFKDFGVDEIITGGQTMNPSIEDILIAVSKVNAKNVFILPNNKNIILAAKQAKEAYKEKNIQVVETISITQGFAALTSFLSHISVEENMQNMENIIKCISTGQVTFAVRNTKIDNFEIQENDILCMLDGKINNISKDIQEGTKYLIDDMVKNFEDATIITVYYGKEVDEEMAEELQNYLNEKYDYLDIEIIFGGQPLYYYIISVE